MTPMNLQTIQNINSAVLFRSGRAGAQSGIRPWQYVQMEYERVGLTPPAYLPPFETVEDAQIWMCLDSRYNRALMRESVRPAV